jgi:hypothetical protein
MRYLLPAVRFGWLRSMRRVRRRELGRQRAGVSLLEVMFSIGVVMVGLVGIAALLPVAGIQANKGALADSAARLGADAIREFHVRSMGNPLAWRWYDQSGNQFRAVTSNDLAEGNSFCLDSRFVAQGIASSDQSARNRFPYDVYGSGTILRMARITLAPNPLAGPTVVMDALQARQVFASDDSLVFDLPKDRTIGPVQNFSLSSTNQPLRRNATGSLSWMATIVPRLDRVGNLTDEYTLSIVVFSRRVIDTPLNNPRSASERTAVVRDFYGDGIGGGDLQLGAQNDVDLALRSGDWVMLSGRKQRTGSLTPIQVHKWYRVVNAGEDPRLDSGVWVRDVTLIGPDWDGQYLIPIAALVTTQVTIAHGAVAVFEKTIRLETSSLWTN